MEFNQQIKKKRGTEKVVYMEAARTPIIPGCGVGWYSIVMLHRVEVGGGWIVILVIQMYSWIEWFISCFFVYDVLFIFYNISADLLASLFIVNYFDLPNLSYRYRFLLIYAVPL